MATVTLTTDDLARQLANAHNTILQLEQKLTQNAEAHAAELATCKAAVARLTARNTELLNYKRRTDAIIAHPEMSTGNKVAAYGMIAACHAVALREGRKDTDPVRVTREQIAKRTGQSAQSVGDSLDQLKTIGAIVKDAPHWDNATQTSYTTMAPTPTLLESPRLLKFPEGEKPNRGGRRTKCPSCGSDAILEYRKWVCSDCGQVVKEHDPKPVNPPPEDEMPETQENSERVKLTSSEKIKVSTSPAKYFPERPTPDKCDHPKNLIRKLNSGDWYCSECGGRNEELMTYGGAV